MVYLRCQFDAIAAIRRVSWRDADRDVQNPVVEKFWIEEDMMRRYRMLEPKIEKLLETLNSEIAGRDE